MHLLLPHVIADIVTILTSFVIFFIGFAFFRASNRQNRCYSHESIRIWDSIDCREVALDVALDVASLPEDDRALKTSGLTPWLVGVQVEYCCRTRRAGWEKGALPSDLKSGAVDVVLACVSTILL